MFWHVNYFLTSFFSFLPPKKKTTQRNNISKNGRALDDIDEREREERKRPYVFYSTGRRAPFRESDVGRE